MNITNQEIKQLLLAFGKFVKNDNDSITIEQQVDAFLLSLKK